MKKKIKGCPDGGYGWVVVIASAIIVGLATSVITCIGTIYANLLETSNFTRTQLTSVMSIISTLWFALAIFPIKLATMYSFKVTLFMGAFLLSCGICLSSLATNNLGTLTLGFVIVGISLSFTALPTTILVGLYFTKKRPIAIAVLLAATGIFNFIFPVIIQWLLNEYHLQNTLLLWSGILLHGCIPAMVIRQPVWAMQTPTTKQQSKPRENDEKLTFLENSENAEEESRISRIYSSLKLILHELIHDFRHFRNPIFILLLGNRMSINFHYTCFALLIPRFAMEQIEDITNIDAAVLLSVTAIADLTVRLCSGLINNFIPNRTITHLISLTCLGIMTLLFQFTYTFPAILTLCLMCGAFSGYIFVTSTVVMFDIFGPIDTPGAIALQLQVTGICLSSSGPLLAWIRDLSGSYAHCYTFLASLIFLSVLLWLSTIECNHKKSKERELKF